MKPAFLVRASLLLAVLALSGGLAQSLGDDSPEGTVITPSAALEPAPEPDPTPEPPALSELEPVPAPAQPGSPAQPSTPDLPNTIEPPVVTAPAVVPAPVQPAPARTPKGVVGDDPAVTALPAKPPARPEPRKLDEPAAPAVAAKPAPKPLAKPAAKPAPKPVTVRPAPKRPSVAAAPTRARMSLILKSTGYNSHRSQTDSTPFVTATGSRVRFGVVALSRDLLRRIPYGSKVLIEDLGTWKNGQGKGRHRRVLSRMIFVVEDTMHPRKAGTIDVWFPARSQAIQWGARRVKITVIEYGRARRR